MTNNDTQTVVIRGKTSFAKILGDPVLNYSKDGKEWKMDLVIDKDTVKEIKGFGIGDRVKTKDGYVDGQPHLTFKQSEFKRSGDANQPIPVKDILGKDWDQSKLLGNGTDVEVKFVVKDHGVGKKKGVYIRGVRVLKLVPYERQEFDAIDENDEFYEEALKAAKAAEAAAQAEMVDAPFETDAPDDAELDDDLPV